MRLNDITIKVHRFGPLENVTFKLAPMMIFTGKSSLGKSYANYLVYYFMSSVCNGQFQDLIKSEDAVGDTALEVVFDLDEFLHNLNAQVETFMRRFLGDDELKCSVEFKMQKRIRQMHIEVQKAGKQPKGLKEDEVEGMIHTSPSYYVAFDRGRRIMVPSFNYMRFYVERQLVVFVLGDYVTRSVILPPGRGAFAGENFSMKSAVASSMDMYNYYFRDYDIGVNNRIRIRNRDEFELHERLLRLTSGGELLMSEGKQYLQLNEAERIALSASASSVKDLAPWLFYLKNCWMLSCSFCMEEPEAHQHPAVTIQIADVIAMSMHQNAPNLFHLTTHSDYLIQRLNQLVRLGYIRREDRTLFERICEERGLDAQGYLDAKDIHAYYFRRDESGRTVVERLKVTDEGIPMNSFFDVVRDLNDREEYINDAVYTMEKKGGSDDQSAIPERVDI